MFRLDLPLAGNTGIPQALMIKHITFQGKEKQILLRVNPGIFKTGYRTTFLSKPLAVTKGWGTTTAFPQVSPKTLCVYLLLIQTLLTTLKIFFPLQQMYSSYLQAFWVISSKELPVIHSVMLMNCCKHGVLGSKTEH